MEVTLLEPGIGIASDEREHLVLGILEYRTGICGLEVCQYCGRPGTFTGWAGAVGSRFSEEFLGSRHGHGDP
jgi:hypothetical protein